MASLTRALTSLLLSDADVSGVVGNRVHWLVLPRSVTGRPYLNLQIISGVHDYHLAGATGLVTSRVQVDAWADSHLSAHEAAAAAKALLSGYHGTHAGVVFQGVFIQSERDRMGNTTGGESQLFRVSVDIEISWNLET